MHLGEIDVCGSRRKKPGVPGLGDRRKLVPHLGGAMERDVGDPLPERRQHVARTIGAVEDRGEARLRLGFARKPHQALEVERAPIGGSAGRAEQRDRRTGRRRRRERGARLGKIVDDDDGRVDDPVLERVPTTRRPRTPSPASYAGEGGVGAERKRGSDVGQRPRRPIAINVK